MPIAIDFAKASKEKTPWELRAEPTIHKHMLQMSQYRQAAPRLRMIGNLAVPFQGRKALQILMHSKNAKQHKSAPQQ